MATSLLAYEACSSRYIFAGGPLGNFFIAASWRPRLGPPESNPGHGSGRPRPALGRWRSEEHTSELQSLRHLVCRLLLEKRKGWGTTCGVALGSLRAGSGLWSFPAA